MPVLKYFMLCLIILKQQDYTQSLLNSQNNVILETVIGRMKMRPRKKNLRIFPPLLKHIPNPMPRILFTGTNYDEVKRLCGDKVLAPYFCMGFSMLSVDTGEGFVSVNEGDTIVLEDDGTLRIEK